MVERFRGDEAFLGWDGVVDSVHRLSRSVLRMTLSERFGCCRLVVCSARVARDVRGMPEHARGTAAALSCRNGGEPPCRARRCAVQT